MRRLRLSDGLPSRSSRSSARSRSGRRAARRTRRRFPTSTITSSTARSAPRRASACRTGSGGCCRRSSRTSCRSVRASATSASASCSTRSGTRGRSARRTSRAASRASGSTARPVTSAPIARRPTSPRQIVSGMPANQMDLQGYANFLTACANDPRFNYGTLMAAIRKENPDIGWFDRLLYRLFVVGATKNGILERARDNAWFERRPPFGPGRVDTFNPYKVILEHSDRRRGRHGRSAVALEPADAGADVAALGRQQRFGRGAEQERGHRRRRDARLARPRVDEAHRELDSRPEAAAVSGGAHRQGARPGGPPRLGAGVRELPLGREPDGRPGDQHRERRHRSGAAELVHAGARARHEHHRRREAVALQPFPQDERLRQHAARRPVAARAVPAQRIGADAARAALSRRASGRLLPRLRRLRLDQRRVRVERSGGRGRRRPFDTSLKGNSNAGHSTARSSRGRSGSCCSNT